MTVKDAIHAIRKAKGIYICWGGNAIPFRADDPLEVDAYGKYLVDTIEAAGAGCYEIGIVARPVKEGE